MKAQPGILVEQIPPLARHVFFTLADSSDLPRALQVLGDQADGMSTVVGLGSSVMQALEQKLEPLRVFPALSNQGLDVPSTQQALWLWLRGDDRGELLA